MLIRHLTEVLGKVVCYVSSDESDPGLTQDKPSILPYYIGTGIVRIVFFHTLQADVMLTQLLDLDNLFLKRSVHPVHYVHMFHSMVSTHMADRADSYDHYDTILCAGPHHVEEIRKRESLHNLNPKQLIEHGYARLEQLIDERVEPPEPDGRDIHVLLAPSWGERTILNLYGQQLTAILLEAGFQLTLRPHFQTRWNTPKVIDGIVDRFGGHEKFTLVEQMSESNSLYSSHLMITDWSGAGIDYGLGLEKPVLYIDVPPKSRNETYRELEIEPFESRIRGAIGAILSPEKLDTAPEVIRQLLEDRQRIREQVRSLRRKSVFNLGKSAPVGAIAVARIAEEVAGSG
ncbi:MAG: CDP-glycerol glycerophosphotransferase family protein [Gammaproteobacteria bacterium]|nr:CDP-glycerol glycerophosphotransferase family protein [Gammaproteobacteria bacterium]